MSLVGGDKIAYLTSSGHESTAYVESSDGVVTVAEDKYTERPLKLTWDVFWSIWAETE